MFYCNVFDVHTHSIRCFIFTYSMFTLIAFDVLFLRIRCSHSYHSMFYFYVFDVHTHSIRCFIFKYSMFTLISLYVLFLRIRSLAPFLTQAGICKSKQTDAIRLQKKLLEQDFMKSVIDPILRLANAPPILLQYGSQPNSVYRTKLFIVLYICKKTMIRAFNCVYTVIACNVYLVPVLHDLNPLIF